MISMISGKIEEVGSNYAVVGVNGLGYKVFVTADTLHNLTVGSSVTFPTYLAVRDDALDLYGFKTRKEKSVFELLLKVPGIGPRSAIGILSAVSAETLMGAIRTGSTAHLTKISGIGKKKAEKIVMELKDKLELADREGDEEMAKGFESELDAIEALKALGYSAEESRDALKKVGASVTDVGAKVKAALKVLS